MITTIITALNTATSLPVKPLLTDNIEDCIIYTFYIVTDDGGTAHHRLELRLITKTVAVAEAKKKKIIETLVNTGNNIKNEVINCTLNGGGMLYDEGTSTFHTLMFFDLISKTYNN